MTTAYITVKELRLQPFNINESELDDAQALFLLDVTTEIINQQCKQDFFKEGEDGKEVDRRHTGNGKFILFLNKRLISLKEIRFFDTEQSFTTFDALDFLITTESIEWKVTTQITTRLRIGGVFPKGAGTVGVIGVFGFETVPTPIKYVQGLMVRNIIQDKSFAVKNATEKLGDHAFTVAQYEGQVTGDREVDHILRRFRRFEIGVV